MNRTFRNAQQQTSPPTLRILRLCMRCTTLVPFLHRNLMHLDSNASRRLERRYAWSGGTAPSREHPRRTHRPPALPSPVLRARLNTTVAHMLLHQPACHHLFVLDRVPRVLSLPLRDPPPHPPVPNRTASPAARCPRQISVLCAGNPSFTHL